MYSMYSPAPEEKYGGKAGMSSKFNNNPTAKSERITRLVENLYRNMPEIEPARAVLLTESYKETEGEPIIMRAGPKPLRTFSWPISPLP